MVGTRKRKYGDDAPTLAEHRVMDGSILQVLECVLSHLAVVDVCRLSTVCKEWCRAARTNKLWQHICEREGVHLQEHFDGQERCYKLLYKDYWLLRKKWVTGEGATTFRKTLTTPAGQDFNGHCLAVSNGHIFAAKSGRYHAPNIYVFTTGDGQYSHQLVGLPQRPRSLLLSHDGMKTVAYAGSVVCVWNVDRPHSIHMFDHPANIATMVVHNQTVAVCLRGYNTSPNVFVWSIESGLLLHRLAGLNQARLAAVNLPTAMVMDDQHIALHDGHGCNLQLWDVNTGDHLYTWTRTDPFTKLLLDSATSSLVCLNSKWLAMWDTGTGVRRVRIDAANNVRYGSMMVYCGRLIVAKTTHLDNNWQQSILVFELKQNGVILDPVNTAPSCGLVHGQILCVHGGLALVVDGVKINVWDAKKWQFIRQISPAEQGRWWVLGTKTNASSKQLRIVMGHHRQLTFVKYDLGD